MRLWKFLLLLVGLTVLGGVAILTFNFVVMPRLIHRNPVVLMPDLRGMSVSGAQTETHALHLAIEETRQRAHPSIPAGMILEQTPVASAPIRRGRVVRVVTSSGPPVAGAPNMIGLEARQAENTLQRESFRLGRVVRIRRPGVSEPTVVFQNPNPGVRLRKGRPVDLVIAVPASPQLQRMPDLRGKALYLVRETIAAAGCVLAPVVYERSGDRPPNVVLRQSPPGGQRIKKGTRIELVASSR